MQKINIFEKTKELTNSHNNILLAEVNNHSIRLALNDQSTFDWHCHEYSDEILFVIEGKLEVQFSDGNSILLQKMDFLKIPKNSIHKTIAKGKTINLCFTKTEDTTVFHNAQQNTLTPNITEKINFSTWLKNNSHKIHENELIWEINDHCLRFAINSGEYKEHNHPNSDEAFILITNSLCLELNSDKIILNEMDILAMPKTINHKPTAKNKTAIIFFEATNCTTTTQ